MRRYGIGQVSYPRVPETSLNEYLVATEIPLKTGAQTPRLYSDTYDYVAEAHPCFLSHALHFFNAEGTAGDIMRDLL